MSVGSNMDSTKKSSNYDEIKGVITGFEAPKTIITSYSKWIYVRSRKRTSVEKIIK